MDTSFYEYTKSAKDVKKFVCEEKCREIALAFDKFNAESGVYEFFGDVLLEVAKEYYEMTFESTSIESYLEDKRLEPPVFEKIEIEESWYDESQDIRNVSKRTYPGDSYITPNYYWYTLWKIAKEYNGKNGCVTTQSPTTKYPVGYYFEMNWGKGASRITNDKKLMEEYEDEETMGMKILVFASIWIVVLFLILLCWMIAHNIPFLNSILYETDCFSPFSITFFTTIISFAIWGFSKIKEINSYVNEQKLKFIKHCKNIQENRESRYYLD